MAQTTTAFPTAATSVDQALETTWTAPTNVFSDNATNATVSVAALGNSGRLEASGFNLLSEDAGGLVGTGVKIPAGASILGIRYAYEYSLSSGNSPTITLAGLGHTAAGVVQAMAVRSYGWGTLGAGSTVNVGNTWNSHNLAVESGQDDARASLADPGLVLTVKGANAAGINNAAFAVDFLRVEVQWILRIDGTGAASAQSFCSGMVKAFASQPGKGLSFSFGSGEVKAQATPPAPGASATAFASGLQKPVMSMSGTTSTTAFASALSSVIATRSGTVTASAFCAGAATVQGTQSGVTSTSAFASGAVTQAATQGGDVADASASSSGVAKPIVTLPGSSSTTSHASAIGTVAATGGGVATSYVSALGTVAATVNRDGTAVASALASGSPSVTTNGDGLAVAYTFAQGGASQSITRDSAATTTAAASGEVFVVATAYAATGGAGTFPTTGVLDDFNRANGAPGEPWHPNRINSGSPIGVAIDGNRLARNGDNGWMAGPFGPDCESYCTVAVPPTSGSYLALFNRITDGGGVAPWDGYGLVIIEGSPWTWSLRRYDDNGNNQLANPGGPTLAAGDMIGFEIVGSTLRAWHKPAAGVWAEVASAVDGNYSSAGGIGIELGDDTARVDDFGGGAITLPLSGMPAAYAGSSGVARAYSFAISGYAYDQNEIPLEGRRVDVYRTSDHAHMGRLLSAADGFYSLAIPNQPEVFWVRFYDPGPPETFDTTGENLVLVESRVQGPPE